LAAAGMLTWTGITANAGEPKATAHSVVRSSALLVKPPVPTGGAYLGLDPAFSPLDAGAGPMKDSTDSGLSGVTTLATLATVEAAIGRVPAVVLFFTQFQSPPPLADMQQVAAQGSIPMLSWRCGSVDSAVAAGNYDGVIRAEAEALKGFGKPMMLRWYWEMNLNLYSPSNTNTGCLGTTSGTPAQVDQYEETEYIAAYERIWNIFQEVGASNVAFVWAPSASHTSKSAQGFYPCSSSDPDDPANCPDVDWIGTDNYDRTGQALPQNSFKDWYGPNYDLYVGYGKPMMLTETGAPQTGCPTCLPQVPWLQEIEADLPADFPALRGFIYVDATDQFDYKLTPAGMQQFENIGKTGYFSKMGMG
jgi:hypothetical protein